MTSKFSMNQFTLLKQEEGKFAFSEEKCRIEIEDRMFALGSMSKFQCILSKRRRFFVVTVT